MAIDAKEQAAVIADGKPSEVDALREQVAALTEQIAALTARPKSSNTSEQRSSRPIKMQSHRAEATSIANAFSPQSGCRESSMSVNRDISPVNDVTKRCSPGAADAPISYKPRRCVRGCAVRSKATTTLGRIGGVGVEIMLDSGSSLSLVQRNVLLQANNVMQIQAPRPLQLVTASGEQLPIVEHIRAPIKVGELELMHDFVVVDSLVAPVTLEVDFLQGNG